MPDKIVVKGIARYDGEYELELEDRPLTSLEWRWVKQISGYLPLTLEEGLSGGDADLFTAFAVIAMRRSGKIDKPDVLKAAEELADGPFGSTITFVSGDTEEPDAGPPVLASTSEHDGSSPRSSDTQKSPSGEPSTPSSDRSDATLPATGTGGSDTSFPAALATTSATSPPVI